MRRSASLSASLRVLLTVIAGIAFIGAVLLVDQSLQSQANSGPLPGRGGPSAERDKDKDAEKNEEEEEQAESVEKKLEALEAAERNDRVGQIRPLAAAAAAGWTGETPLDATADDWEPAIAADPAAGAGWVYTLTT